ncbi:MAG: glycosyltransferase family 4 protein [candidate division Zixibacteria bacterium]|nr:glycosyltransferase family 4 protein [candidate division Zixibacteria bacterium]
MDDTYILQYGSISGLPFQYARAARLAGLNSKNVIAVNRDFGELNRGLPFDASIAEPSDSRLTRMYKKARFFFGDVIPNTSLVHYYSDSLFRRYLDCGILSGLRRPMVISFAGTDVRLESSARRLNPYVYIPPYSAGEAKIKKKLELIGKYISFAATDFELGGYVEPYFEKVFYLPQPVNLEHFAFSPPDRNVRRPVVIHIPTNREVKGTADIEAAVERLKADGLDFEFRLLECNLTQEQVKRKIAGADIVANEIRTGSFGVFALEAMASGKPNISYLREDLKEKYPPELPIVSANPDTIYQVLKDLIRDADRRVEVGKAGRAYVEKYHPLATVGEELKRIYSECGLSVA